MIENKSAPKTDEEVTRLILSSAALYPKLVDHLDYVDFVSMSPETYRESPFLNHRIIVSDDFWARIPLDVLTELLKKKSFSEIADGSTASHECTRFIFHIGHVGSTLITKVLGSFDHVLALQEPLLLLWLTSYKVNLGKPESRISHDQYMDRLRIAITLLSKKFEETDDVVIKATSFTSVIADDILDQTEESKAIFVYTALEPYMATLLKGEGGDVVRAAPGRLKRLNSMVDGDGFILHKMSRGEIIAMTWVTEMLTLNQVAQSRANRVLWLDFDSYLADPSKHLPGLLKHLEIRHSNADLDRVLSSDIHSKYAKSTTPEDYCAEDRMKDIERVLRDSKDDIESGKRWIDSAASAIPQIQFLVPLVSS